MTMDAVVNYYRWLRWALEMGAKGWTVYGLSSKMCYCHWSVFFCRTCLRLFNPLFVFDVFINFLLEGVKGSRDILLCFKISGFLLFVC